MDSYPKNVDFAPKLSNVGGRFSIVRQHDNHAKTMAKIKPVVETNPPASINIMRARAKSRAESLKRSRSVLCKQQIHGENLPPTNTILSKQRKSDLHARLFRGTTKQSYSHIMNTREGLPYLSKPAEDDSATNSRRYLQSYLAFGVNIPGGMAKNYLDHEKIRMRNEDLKKNKMVQDSMILVQEAKAGER